MRDSPRGGGGDRNKAPPLPAAASPSQGIRTHPHQGRGKQEGRGTRQHGSSSTRPGPRKTSPAMLTGTSRRVSARPALRSLHWLPVKQRIQFKALCTIFKAVNGASPGFLKQGIQRYVPDRALWSSHAKLISPRALKASWGGRSFSHCATKARNGLPFYLRNHTEFLPFRRDLKTWLFG